MRPITKTDFEEWKENHVTQAFMREAAEDIDDLKNMRIYGNTEEMIRAAHERNAELDILENMIKWKPKDLLNQEE